MVSRSRCSSELTRRYSATRSDLWVLDPGARLDEYLEGEEGMRQWERAVELADVLNDFATSTDLGNGAVTQLIWDAAVRAREALRRAQERAKA